MSISIDDLNQIDFSDIVEHDTPLAPVTPGEILEEGFMKPYQLSANALARAIGVPANRITALLKNTRSITANTALRLGYYFGMSPKFWLSLQFGYDLKKAEAETGDSSHCSLNDHIE